MFKNKFLNVLRKSKQFITPPPILTPSKWVEENLIFPDGPLGGRKMKLFEFQKDMINSINEDKRKIVFMTSAQIGKTTVLNGILFFKTSNDPGNAGIIQATANETTQWLTAKIRPLIDASPEMQKIITDKNDRNAVNNTKQIQLRNGGFWYFMSLSSLTTLRSKTLPLILMDEVDAVSTETDEGNPIAIAEARATMFGEDARIIICSTPTGKYGAINSQFELSDKRKYHIPCPKCEHKHEMLWEHVKYEKMTFEGKQVPDPDTAYYECPKCEHKFTEPERLKAINSGNWIITNPQADTIGFHLSRLYSPTATIKSLVSEYKDRLMSYSLSTFYQTVLGIPFDDLNEDIEVWKLEQLKTDIGFEQIDDDIKFLTAGVDLQGDRIEVTVLGHTRNRIDVLGHKVIRTISTSNIQDSSYKELLRFVKTPFKTVSGNSIPMVWVNFDSGDNTKTVYRFCEAWTNLHAIKGSAQLHAPIIPVTPTNKGGYQFYSLGVSRGKTFIREMLNRAVKPNAVKSIDVRISKDCVPDDYCEQLMSEELRRSGNSQRWFIKKGGVRNECLDTMNYALAARFQVLDHYNWNHWYSVKQEPVVIEHDETESVDVVNSVKTLKERHRPVVHKTNKPKRGWLK
ncbi:terminase gpA endonuclease subunit [Serratia marcescens]|uniref:terminase gpA endonuclease subunit n=3 Tax=Serratia marcescens TaxID=615 RepID=UPI0009496553|nr:terminase gpA endonuclease subunit [Serratia marcescens]BEN87061.1 terminase [Serratia marcescens]BEN92248.1 terminase [Serratia marcescens]BEN97574.1 terminase [Serratia marcescens]